MTDIASLPEIPDLTLDQEAAAMAFLEENHPHAALKVSKIHSAAVKHDGIRNAAFAESAALAEQGRALIARANHSQRLRDTTGLKWTQEDEKRDIEIPRKQGERKIQESKQIRDATKREPTITAVDLLSNVNTKRRYVDARIDVQSEDPAADLAECREKIEANKQETFMTRERSHRLPEEAIDNGMHAVDVLADAGEPKVGSIYARVLQASGRPMPPTIEPPVQFSSASGGTTIHNGPAFVAWLFRDELKAKLRELIEAKHKPERAISDSDRLEKLAALKAESIRLGRIEEALIELCEARGINVVRRPDANPLAVLGLALDTSPVAEADDAEDDFAEADFG